jgi:hypothetical protein
MINIEEEVKTLEEMVKIYCGKKHNSASTCEECIAILDYAEDKLRKCKFGTLKPTCKKCTVHCYGESQRDKIKEIMRFSGKLMIRYHPVMALKHLMREIK